MLNQISSPTNQLKYPVPIEIKFQWENYISSIIKPEDFSASDKHRFALTEFMYQQEQQGRTLYHLSITYKPHESREYSESDINKFFINFYTKTLLRYLLGTRNIHRLTIKHKQPITLCFVDRGQNKASESRLLNQQTISNDTVYAYPDNLHHHAILAVHTDTVAKMDTLLGTNKLVNGDFTHKPKTNDLRKCEAMTTLYANKSLKKYPDFLSFPDSFN